MSGDWQICEHCNRKYGHEASCPYFAERYSNLPSPAERFGQHVTDPVNDPEPRFYKQQPVKSREQLEKEQAEQWDKVQEFLRKKQEETADVLLNPITSVAGALGAAIAQRKPPVEPARPVALIGIGGGPTRATTLPEGSAERKQYPIATGVLDYFGDAIVAIAHLSYTANSQHNPGQEVHWARGKSKDHADTLVRHFVQRGTVDTDGIRHSVKVAWRALALLQEELEAEQKDKVA